MLLVDNGDGQVIVKVLLEDVRKVLWKVDAYAFQNGVGCRQEKHLVHVLLGHLLGLESVHDVLEHGVLEHQGPDRVLGQHRVLHLGYMLWFCLFDFLWLFRLAFLGLLDCHDRTFQMTPCHSYKVFIGMNGQSPMEI